MNFRVGALSILLGGASVFSDDCIDSSKGHIDDVVCDTEGLETLCAAISSLPDLVESLGREDVVYTLFAPENGGFDRYIELYYPGQTIDDLVADPVKTEALLLNHIIVGWTPVCFDDLRCSTLMYMGDGDTTKTICIPALDGPTTDECKYDQATSDPIEDGEEYYIYQKGANRRSDCNFPKIESSSIGAKNGVIHVVNNVIA